MRFLIVTVLIALVAALEYDDKIKDYDSENSSVDSVSNEVFKNSSREKPPRIASIEVDSQEGMTSVREQLAINETTVRPKMIVWDYSFSVSIQKRNTHYATGALVSDRWIITAAADFYNVRESIKLFRARFGTVNCKKGGVLRALKGIEVHPLYVPNNPDYDVALLRLAQPIIFSDVIKPISISKHSVNIVSAKFRTTYWPRLIVNGQVLPETAKERTKQNNMRVSAQKTIPWEKCNQLLQSSNYTLDHSSSCLEPIVTHHSTCMPDVGAPVTADEELWGITSGWTLPDCDAKNSPTLFTKLAARDVQAWLTTFFNV
ncbi:trypsin-like [Leptidea sinapis]|uniref:trypsin-like n=1 Tax=Leptidea sinapis TaxID=189913 RepID=UPI002138EF64|nr:trypsin-like [Leptidea sinapis]